MPDWKAEVVRSAHTLHVSQLGQGRERRGAGENTYWRALQLPPQYLPGERREREVRRERERRREGESREIERGGERRGRGERETADNE